MSHVLKLNNFEITTADELSKPRQAMLLSAVMQARGSTANARLKTFEALACLQQPGVVLQDLPDRFMQHFKTLFRCNDDKTFLSMLGQVAALVQVLDNAICSPALRFKEYGTDLVSNVVNSLASMLGQPTLYQPTNVAYVRAFTLPSGTGYMGPQHVQACINTGKSTGNPNEIMIRLTSLDGMLEKLMDTVIHEATHKFLGTDDEGMQGATFDWMKDDGLASYRQNFPNMPLPMETPGFLKKTPHEAMSNAYLLTAYIIYLPFVDISARTELNRQARTSNLASTTPLGQHLRTELAKKRPPDA